MVKKTYGEQIIEHRNKNLELEDDVIEYRRAMEPDVIKRVYKCAEDAKNHPLYVNHDFYVVLVFRVQRIGQGVDAIPVARKSCPTPTYKQSVWKYHRQTASLEFLWSIPDAILYWHIWNNREKLMHDKEISDLVKFVVLMETGELFKWILKENGEKLDAVIKINQNTEESECIMN